MGETYRKPDASVRGAARPVRETGEPSSQVAPDAGTTTQPSATWVNAGKQRPGSGRRA